MNETASTSRIKLQTKLAQACQANDMLSAIDWAVQISDILVSAGEHRALIDLARHLIVTFKHLRGTTRALAFLKTAIRTVPLVLADLDDTQPDEHTLYNLYALMVSFPHLAAEDKILASEICQSIQVYYTNGNRGQLYAIACFLPTLQQAFETSVVKYRYLSSTDDYDWHIHNEQLANIKYCIRELFTDKPYPSIENNPYDFGVGDLSNHNYIVMASLLEGLKQPMLGFSSREDFENSETKNQWEQVVHFFENGQFQAFNLDILRTCYLVLCHAYYRNIDFSKALSCLEPYAQQLQEYPVLADTATSTLIHILAALSELASIYHLNGQLELTYGYYLRYLKVANIYYKRRSFEQDSVGFNHAIKEDYSNVDQVAFLAVAIGDSLELPLENLYLQLAKRKNLIFLREWWERQGNNHATINQLLEQDIDMSAIYNALGQDKSLIDIMHIHEFNADIEGKAYYIAFVIEPDKPVRLLYCRDDSVFREQINNENHDSPYFEQLIEHLLGGLSTPNLLISVSGAFTKLNFSGIKYRDEYVVDYHALAYLATVYQLVSPSTTPNIQSALLFTAPTYGEHKIAAWGELTGSKREGDLIRERLIQYGLPKLCELSGSSATRENLLSGLSTPYDIIHISTHAEVVNGHLRLLTAGANHSNVQQVDELELTSEHITKSHLTVLAMCEGAYQQEFVWDSLSGFIKSALLSGAESIIAPTKPVKDMQSSILLDFFYQHYLADPEKIPSHALQAAIQQFRKLSNTQVEQIYEQRYHIPVKIEADYPFVEPRYWDAWVCYSK